MATSTCTAKQPARSQTAVKGMLRDIGYVLWLSRQMASEIKGEAAQPVRPEMAEFCEVDMAAFAA